MQSSEVEGYKEIWYKGFKTAEFFVCYRFSS
jgi:hypothetical protein